MLLSSPPSCALLGARLPSKAWHVPRQRHCDSLGPPRPCASSNPLRPGETADEALQRRLRETARVEERLVQVATEEDFQAQLQQVRACVRACVRAGGRVRWCVAGEQAVVGPSAPGKAGGQAVAVSFAKVC